MCWVSKHSVTHHKPRYYLVASWTSWEHRRWTVIERFPQYRAVAERPKLPVQFPDWKRSHVRRTSRQGQNGASGSVFISTPRHAAGANTRKSLPIYNLWTICFRRSLPSHFYVLEDFFPQNLCFVKRLVGTSSGLFLPFRLQPKQHSFRTRVLNSHKMINLPASALGLPFTTSVRNKILLFVKDPVSGILF